MPAKTMRTFIAIPMPAAAKAALAEVSAQLGAELPPKAVRWVAPAQMHLTLVFLGNTAVSQLPALGEMMTAAAATVAPFDLHLGEVGCFPHCRRPRVVWVGMAGTQAALTRLHQLQRALAQGVAELGWELEKRPFRPHLTLGRVKDSRLLSKIEWGSRVEKVEVPEMGVVPVTAVQLVESQLRPSGPIYTTQHSAVLTAGGVGGQ